MPQRAPFRHRAHEVSRTEAFSDVIFGFAISLLVVSLEAPKSYAELMETVRGFIPFTICFFILIDIWYEHHDFYKRYAMHDRLTMALNTMLLFVVLYYVYPLKYMFTALLVKSAHEGTLQQARNLYSIYGLGVFAVFGILTLMYVHAYKKRGELQLNDVEQVDTRESIYDNASMAGFGLLSVILACTPLITFAGVIYFFIAVPKTIIPWVMGAKRRRVEETMALATGP